MYICKHNTQFILINTSKFKEKVKEFLGKICTKVPSSIEGECEQFVNTYGDVVVALLAQEIDPSQVMYFLYLKYGDQ